MNTVKELGAIALFTLTATLGGGIAYMLLLWIYHNL
jgi:hypothetical protein